MCIHGIEEKCVQSERAPRVKYSYEPTKKKRRRETVCKERETLARPSPTFFPLPQIFLFFFFCLLKEKQRTKNKPKKFHHQKARVHVYPPLCHYPPPS